MVVTWWIVAFCAVLIHINKIQGSCVTPICITKLNLVEILSTFNCRNLDSLLRALGIHNIHLNIKPYLYNSTYHVSSIPYMIYENICSVLSQKCHRA